jgi:metal transporter CNNM
VTLLLFNAVANEAMPVFLEKLVPPYLAVLLSVTLVLIFGEIIPSALFTGRNQILLAAKLSSFVWFLLYVLYPITFPISKILDCVFGHEEEKSISRNELEAFVILQNAACREEYDEQVSSGSNSSDTTAAGACSDLPPAATASELSRDEVGIMTGVLRLSQLTALDAMIPIAQVCMISSGVVLHQAALRQVAQAGFSRLPVFREGDREFLLGYLLVKRLVALSPAEEKQVASLELLEPIVVHPTEDLLEMLNIFQVLFLYFENYDSYWCLFILS